MFGRDFEVDAWSRFWKWNLIKICVRTTQALGPLCLRQCFICNYVPIMCIWQLKLTKKLSRDIHHGLTNLANIDLWALLHLSVLLIVGVTQVIFFIIGWKRRSRFDQSGISRCSWWSNYLKTSLLSEDSPQTFEIYKTYISWHLLNKSKTETGWHNLWGYRWTGNPQKLSISG